MSRRALFICLASIALLAKFVRAESPEVIDVSGFRDGAHHWRDIRDDSRVIQALPDQPSYQPEQVREIANNILLYQRANGGWPKDYDMLAVLTDEQKKNIVATHSASDTSFDNHNIFSQVDYLARAFAATNDTRYRDACLRGLDFMFAAQYADGGIPQRFPRPKSFHAHITFNDGVMIGVLRVFKAAAEARPHFVWLDADRRKRADDAVKRGVECILKCQIRVDGKQTGWCQQHDEKTYAAASARTFELASICPGDTTEIVSFLMSLDSPTPETINAVKAAVAWLKQVPISGIEVQRVRGPKEEFERHTADFDFVVVSAPKARPIWARHYEIGSNRPIFAGRDGLKKYRLADVERERRTGTPWYGYWPAALVATDYPRWQQRIKRATD